MTFQHSSPRGEKSRFKAKGARRRAKTKKPRPCEKIGDVHEISTFLHKRFQDILFSHDSDQLSRIHHWKGVEVPVHHDAIFTFQLKLVLGKNTYLPQTHTDHTDRSTVSRQAGAKTKNWDSIKFAW
jgi:hypothetical protein